ncbi:MAG: chemotaxis protein, partial [Tardiphaga sp.]|nr:chemotaxis protein [Tardiphaga sp.]
MLASLSIRAKITSVVAFLLIAMTGMGVVAVRKMQAINTSAVDIQTNWLPSVRLLGELRAGAITYRNVIRQHMLSETLDEKMANEKTLETVVASNNAIREKYEKLISLPEERTIYQDWSKAWDDYKKGTREVMDLSRKSVGRIPQEANALNTKTVNLIGLKADELLNKDIELNNKGSDIAGKDAADNYESAFLVVSIILVASAVIGIGVGIYLVKDVSSGIASIVKPMQALGAGDLTAVVPHQGMKT